MPARCVLSLAPLCRYPNTHPIPFKPPLGVCVTVYLPRLFYGLLRDGAAVWPAQVLNLDFRGPSGVDPRQPLWAAIEAAPRY